MATRDAVRLRARWILASGVAAVGCLYVLGVFRLLVCLGVLS